MNNSLHRSVCTVLAKLLLMITKDDLKKEVDKLPEALVEDVYAMLKHFVKQQKADWADWSRSLDNFTSDFMQGRDKTDHQERESFDV
jgi:hypothetical protein